MKLNIDKCMMLAVTLKNNSSTLCIHNHRLALVTSAKHLVVTVDSKLSFNKHVIITCKKANSVLAFLRRNFRSCQWKIKTDLYLTYVKPILYQSGLLVQTVSLPHCIILIHMKPYNCYNNNKV